MTILKPKCKFLLSYRVGKNYLWTYSFCTQLFIIFLFFPSKLPEQSITCTFHHQFSCASLLYCSLFILFVTAQFHIKLIFLSLYASVHYVASVIVIVYSKISLRDKFWINALQGKTNFILETNFLGGFMVELELIWKRKAD